MRGYPPAVAIARARGNKLAELERLLSEALLHLEKQPTTPDRDKIIAQLRAYFTKKNQSKIA